MVFISKLNKAGRFRPKHVIIYFANKYRHLAYNYICVSWLKLTHH